MVGVVDHEAARPQSLEGKRRKLGVVFDEQDSPAHPPPYGTQRQAEKN
jgi:hypothetical protein